VWVVVAGCTGGSKVVGQALTTVRELSRLKLQTTIKRLPDGKFVEVLSDGSIRPIESMTDWEAFDALIEDEVTAAALSDPENPPTTEEELAQAKHSTSPKAIRQRLKLTQEQFAE
jgi:hypothetical protein